MMANPTSSFHEFLVLDQRSLETKVTDSTWSQYINK